MFNIGFTELIILGVLGLIILGPEQLPQVARKLARTLNELKRAANDAMSPIDDIKKQALYAAEKARYEARIAAEEALKTNTKTSTDSDKESDEQS
jgi:sec-independent protein translocase protein TatB